MGLTPDPDPAATAARSKPVAKILRMSDGRRQIAVRRDFTTTTMTLRESEYDALFAQIEAEARDDERQRIYASAECDDCHAGKTCLNSRHPCVVRARAAERQRIREHPSTLPHGHDGSGDTFTCYCVRADLLDGDGDGS